ncbi:MAG: hypothetical protein FWE09_06665 [Treponema sp.]|nr:hypothetical protein [Treponema sp.]
MARTAENLALFEERVKPYHEEAKRILLDEKAELEAIKADGQAAGSYSSPKKMALAEEMLNLASQYLAVNGISGELLKSRDESALGEARKAVLKSIMYAEEVVTGYVDAPFSDYKDKLDEIESVSPAARFALVQKMGLSIDLIELGYGDNSKWKWTFADLSGRLAVVAKNLLNLDQIAANTDMRSPHYEPTIRHLRLTRKLLANAAERQREKYELFSKSADDFSKSLNYLSALKRLNLLTGAREEADIIRRKIDVWNSKLTADMKRKAADKK